MLSSTRLLLKNKCVQSQSTRTVLNVASNSTPSSLIFCRTYAAGVRQGSSISNVKTVKFGRYEIPARLLKRWKIKHADLIKTWELKKKENKKQIWEKEQYSFPYEEMKDKSTTEIADAMSKLFITYKTIRPAWIGVILDSVKDAKDFEMAADAWIMFQTRVGTFTETSDYGHKFAEAAIRSGQEKTFFRILRDTRSYKITDSTLWRYFIQNVPAEHMEEALKVLSFRAFDRKLSRKLLMDIFKRCQSKKLAPLAKPYINAYKKFDYPINSSFLHCIMLIEFALGEKNIDELQSILENNSVAPTDGTNFVYINCHLAEKNIDEAVKIWRNQVEKKDVDLLVQRMVPTDVDEATAVAFLEAIDVDDAATVWRTATASQQADVEEPVAQEESVDVEQANEDEETTK